jgi:hypothetical protein
MAKVLTVWAFLLAAMALAGTGGIATAQESSPTDPAPRLVVFEIFTRFT